MKISEILKERKTELIITILIIFIGSILFFTIKPESGSSMGESTVDPELFKDLEIKAAFSEEGAIKLFVLAKNSDLVKLKSVEGNSVPEIDSIVIGFEEANMMIEEKLFSKVGDKIDGLFGINTTVSGILKKTNSPVDDIHFISESAFSNLQGDLSRVYIRLSKDNMPLLFYQYKFSETLNAPINLVEGNLNDYVVNDIAGKRYYPMILGYADAEVMREAKLFSKIGDVFEDFNKSFVIVGIASKTNTSFDMMHIVPLSKTELGVN